MALDKKVTRLLNVLQSAFSIRLQFSNEPLFISWQFNCCLQFHYPKILKKMIYAQVLRLRSDLNKFYASQILIVSFRAYVRVSQFSVLQV